MSQWLSSFLAEQIRCGRERQGGAVQWCLPGVSMPGQLAAAAPAPGLAGGSAAGHDGTPGRRWPSTCSSPCPRRCTGPWTTGPCHRPSPGPRAQSRRAPTAGLPGLSTKLCNSDPGCLPADGRQGGADRLWGGQQRAPRVCSGHLPGQARLLQPKALRWIAGSVHAACSCMLCVPAYCGSRRPATWPGLLVGTRRQAGACPPSREPSGWPGSRHQPASPQILLRTAWGMSPCARRLQDPSLAAAA